MKLHQLLQKIPKNKLTTYKLLALKLKTHPRAIGKLLNTYPSKNCYKVIKSNGYISGYRYGTKTKIKLLKKEFKIKNNKILDFQKHLHKF